MRESSLEVRGTLDFSDSGGMQDVTMVGVGHEENSIRGGFISLFALVVARS